MTCLSGYLWNRGCIVSFDQVPRQLGSFTFSYDPVPAGGQQRSAHRHPPFVYHLSLDSLHKISIVMCFGSHFVELRVPSWI
jgi:hypothetical protein